MKATTLVDASRGVDTNTVISPSAARALVEHGHTFVVRYVRRSQRHDYDISEAERDVILAAGLGLSIVQHVAPEGWAPTGELGTVYGEVAQQECTLAGILPGTTVWLDLEGVARGVSEDDVAEYCNNWFQVVFDAGFETGLYVGDSCGLSASALFELDVSRYWSAYNLNSDNFPATRGVCMRQFAAKPHDLIPGFTNQDLDVDVVATDDLGGTPNFMLA